MIIYKVTHKESGKIYVGQTSRSLSQRIAEHLANNRTSYFDRALRKYGVESFFVETIDVADTKEDLDAKERYYINLFNSKIPNGYNMTDGGEGQVGVRRYGADNPHYGKPHTDETKRLLSALRAKYVKERHPRARAVINKTTGEIFAYMSLACEKYSLDKSTLTKACKGRNKTCGGFVWEYGS